MTQQMMDLAHSLQALFATTIKNSGAELVEIEVKGSKKNPVIKVYVDTPAGITINECTELSKNFRDILEVEQFELANYRLEVSSPGLDRPLKTQRDFERNSGRIVEIMYFKDDDSIAQLTGEILEASATKVVLSYENEAIAIDLDRIKQGKIQLKW